MKRILTMLFLLAVVISIFSTPALAAEAEPEAAQSATVFEEIYGYVLIHSDKILSALAFLASLLLALLYKKGILPLIRGGLNTLSSAVGKLKEESERASEISAKTFSEARDKLEITEKTLSELTERLVTIENELKDARDEQTKANDVKAVLQTQTELLYEIFMSSSIPSYLKESVGEKINAMKKRLDTSEVGRDD